MSYYDWQHLTKPWKIVPVVQDTTVNLKPLSITPVQDVVPTLLTLTIPQTVFHSDPSMTYHRSGPHPSIPVLNASQFAGQFCYSVGQSGSLINTAGQICYPNNPNDFANAPKQYALCVRFRHGDVVKRYVLGDPFYETSGLIELVPRGYIPYPTYTGQIIPSNFVIEVWLLRKVADNPNPNLLAVPSIATYTVFPVVLQTGFMFFAPQSDIVTPNILPVKILDLPDLMTGNGNPPITWQENLPTPQNPDVGWLDNP